ncbi:hypothetical protein ACSSV4_002927 [Roseovarius sp. MBR-154]|jgi:hypothetical protein
MTDEHRSPEEIERRLEQERAGLADSLEALRDNFSIDRIVRQSAEQIREHSGDIGASVSRAVKDNPLAVALTGVGLAWLIFGNGTASDYRSRGAGPEGYAGDHFGPRHSASAEQPRGITEGDDLPSWIRDVDDMHDHVGTGARPGMGHSGEGGKFSEVSRSVREGVRDTAGSARDRAADMKKRLSQGTEDLTIVSQGVV